MLVNGVDVDNSLVVVDDKGQQQSAVAVPKLNAKSN